MMIKCHFVVILNTRLSWLWKFGGLYLDTDILVMEDILSPWSNTSFIGLHNLHPEVGICQSVIKLSRRHPVLIEWLGLLMEQFDPTLESIISLFQFKKKYYFGF